MKTILRTFPKSYGIDPERSERYETHYAIGEERFLCGKTFTPLDKEIDESASVDVCKVCNSLKELELTVVCERAGQDRRYGDSLYIFLFTYHGENEILDDDIYNVAQLVHPAPKGNGYLQLWETVISFVKVGKNQWRYKTGHCYTD
jgi:hypothetical protein